VAWPRSRVVAIVTNHPPRLARRVLRWFVPADTRDSVEGDLAELHAARLASRGRVYATAWYWTETISFASRFLADGARRVARVLTAAPNAASSLDIRLSARLLIKQPGLTLTAGFGIAAAIGITCGFFAFSTALFRPRIPLDEGDRIVALENSSVTVGQPNRRSVADFVTWRDELRTVVDVSAFWDAPAKLGMEPATAEDITVAHMTASGFRLARVSALLGRHLVADDERPGAPPVLVIGHDVWRTRFGGDSSVVGRQVRIDETFHTIVGVMPADFEFPVNHQYWTTLSFEPSRVARGRGPELFVFGRLAPGVTLESARVELAALGRRSADAFPATNAKLRPTILPYAFPFIGIQAHDGGADGVYVWATQLAIGLLVIVVALNVAILVYARTAARRSEIAVRTALGASRRRIVGQLLVEALALSLPPAIVGVGIAQYGVGLGNSLMRQEQFVDGAPFWMDAGLQPSTVAYALTLALVVATIVGVVPGLRATGRNLESDLRRLSGGTGMRLGKLWTTLIVAQVAFAVAILPPALKLGLHEARGAFTKPNYPTQEFSNGWLSMKRPASGGPAPALGARIADVTRELRSHLPVTGVTFVGGAPTGGRGRTDVEGLTLPWDVERRIRRLAVDTVYHDLYGARLLTGRRFEPGDLAESARAVIVNRSFVRRVLGDQPAPGRRLRYATHVLSDTTAPTPWFVIVGVVEDLWRNPLTPEEVAPTVYHPLVPGRLSAVSIVMRGRGALPETFGATVHKVIAATDPDLRLGRLRTDVAVDPEARVALQIIGTVLLLVIGGVLVLSGAGVYALISFTVTQRRREIGIRAALGGSQRQVLMRVLSRVGAQIGAGVAVGALAAVAINSVTAAGTALQSVVLVPIIAVVMIAVGLGAAFAPARRGLAVQPVEALRSE
jgi:putative ABC transport system permease protein